MRRASLVVVLLFLLCQRAVADDVRWQAGISLGAGGFVGRGWSANRIGGSLRLFGEARFQRYIGAQAALLSHSLHLREPEDGGPQGGMHALYAGPVIYPIGERVRFELALMPFAGYSFTYGRIESVRFGSRAALLGGGIEATWPLGTHFALGLRAEVARLFVDAACIRASSRETVCDAMRDDVTRLLTGLVTLRVRLPWQVSPRFD